MIGRRGKRFDRFSDKEKAVMGLGLAAAVIDLGTGAISGEEADLDDPTTRDLLRTATILMDEMGASFGMPEGRDRHLEKELAVLYAARDAANAAEDPA